MSERFVLDRFEGNKAVLENISDLAITICERNDLPPGTREGDVLFMEEGFFVVDRAETKKRADNIRARFEKLKFKRQRS